MTELRSGPSCRGNERFVDQYGDGDTGRYADHYGGSRGKNDTCGCGESARERDERRACGCGAADEAVTRHAETLIDDNGVAYTEKVVKSSCCEQEGKKKLR